LGYDVRTAADRRNAKVVVRTAFSKVGLLSSFKGLAPDGSESFCLVLAARQLTTELFERSLRDILNV
jgi:hypothetical protein